MKKRAIIIGIAGLLLMQLHSCTKNELVTINDPLEMDEDSPLYQDYLVERAINFIKIYRFDKLGDLIDRITDPDVRAEVMACYHEYRAIAAEKALYFVTPENDTLFFLAAVAKEEPYFNVDFEPLFLSLHTQRNMLNTRGVLQGFKNYPAVKTFSLLNCLAYELKGLEGMPLMESFDWEWQAEIMQAIYPDEEFVPVQLTVDLSRNPKLTSIKMVFVDVVNIVFPAYKIKQFSLHGGIINRNDNLDQLAASDVFLSGGTAARGDLVLRSTEIDSLTINIPVDHLDVSRTAIQKLVVYKTKKLTTNQVLRKLFFRLSSLTEKPELPTSLEEIELDNYDFTGLDLSAHTRLKYLALSPSQQAIRMEEWTFPAGIERIDLRGQFTGLVDFSALSSLTDLNVQINPTDQNTDWPIRFPPGLKKLRCIGSLPGTLDISGLANLEQLYISDYPWRLQKIILPPDLTETQVQGMNHGQTIMFISKSTILENAPDWFSQYVTYY